MKKKIIKFLIILICYNPINLVQGTKKDCPAKEIKDCETDECDTLENLKNKYCIQIGDPDKFYNEKYTPAAQTYNKMAELTKDNVAERFQKEKLPDNCAINVRTREFVENAPKDNINYSHLGVDILKEIFPGQTVNCYLLNETINSLKENSLVADPEKMFEYIWNHSCNNDANKLQEATIEIQKLKSLLELPIELITKKFGPKQDVELLISEDTEKYKLEQVKKLIDSLYCKYNICQQDKVDRKPKPIIPILIAAGALTAIAVSLVAYNKSAQRNKVILETEVDLADAKMAARLDEIQATEIDLFMESIGKEMEIERAVVADLAKTVDLTKATEGMGIISLGDILRFKQLNPSEFEEFFDLAKLGKIGELETRLSKVFDAESASKLAADLSKLAKFKV